MNKRTVFMAAAFAALGFALTITSSGKQEAVESSSDKEASEKGQTFTHPVKGKAWTVPELGMNFVYIKSGKFEMGLHNSEADDDEQPMFTEPSKPVHTVLISKPFWLGKFEVTQTQYKELVDANPSRIEGGDHPVERISWHDAMRFCRKLTKRESQAGRLPKGYVYRLPTEAEWEYAARGGSKSNGYKHSGSDDIDEVAWYVDNSSSKTHEVGRKQPNELGIYDMSGNVWEWCYDWYDDDYYSNSPRENPVNTSRASYRVCRGGSCNNTRFCRSVFRFRSAPDFKYFILGFRVALAPEIMQ